MTSGQTNKDNRWTGGAASSWALGATLGLILGLMLLIAIPRMLGGKPAANMAAQGSSTASTSAPGATDTTATGTGTAANGAAGDMAGSTGAASSTGATSSTDGTQANAPAAGAADAEGGKTFFASNCAGCHGANAEGGVGPKLDKAASWNLGQFGAAVHQGKAPDRELAALMPRFTTDQVSDAQLADVHAFLQKTFNVQGSADSASQTAAGTPTSTPASTPADNAANAAAAGTASTAATAAGDAAAGKEKFVGTCAGCHGANGEGGVGPALKVANGWNLDQFTAAVREGKAPDRQLGAMMPHFTADQLSDADVANIHAFVQTLN